MTGVGIREFTPNTIPIPSGVGLSNRIGKSVRWKTFTFKVDIYPYLSDPADINSYPNTVDNVKIWILRARSNTIPTPMTATNLLAFGFPTGSIGVPTPYFY